MKQISKFTLKYKQFFIKNITQTVFVLQIVTIPSQHSIVVEVQLLYFETISGIFFRGFCVFCVLICFVVACGSGGCFTFTLLQKDRISKQI